MEMCDRYVVKLEHYHTPLETLHTINRLQTETIADDYQAALAYDCKVNEIRYGKTFLESITQGKGPNGDIG